MPKRSAKQAAPARRLIETDQFPFDFLSVLAERESWRKEVYRPIYHIHKWWAKRLGSVFRGIILGSLLPDDANLEQAFYEPPDFSGVSVFDPFMGSGTTIGEAHKLGCTALGRDINPVACETVRVALGPLDRDSLKDAFETLSATVGKRIRRLYRSRDESGCERDVLYFFWVKQATCPHCRAAVDLFSSRIFARNAYPDRKPEVQVCCPGCGDIFAARNTDQTVTCAACSIEFNPHVGSAAGTKARCGNGSHEFAIAPAIRTGDRPPSHRLYAKLLLLPGGAKRYLRATADDVADYENCSAQLNRELEQGLIRLPESVLSDGYNTRQAIGYCYRRWRDFFNDRQLLALGWLQAAIAKLPDTATRDAMFTLFSGVLEFNNLFASYKGEGTGAVRHMFSHHILKPERMPIEANIWGTPKSFGSFRNLFASRIGRALEYRAAPFEVSTNGNGKSFDTSAAFSGSVALDWPQHGSFAPRTIYLSCGSSHAAQLPDRCLDLVVTDPPFFDNVHYSELADFFFAWQHLYPHGFVQLADTTRHPNEVQDTDSAQFAAKLAAVLHECYRTLKDDGLLVFTYHHSRPEGWTALLTAIYGAGFSVVNAHPVKAEMSVATPKSQAKSPIQLDVIFVCRKQCQDSHSIPSPAETLDQAAQRATAKLRQLADRGFVLSENDFRVTVISQFVASLGPLNAPGIALEEFTAVQSSLDNLARRLVMTLTINTEQQSAAARARLFEQLPLFS